MGVVRLDGGFHGIQRQLAGLVEGNRAGLDAAQYRSTAAFIFVGVGSEADDVLVAALAVAEQGDQVGLGARGGKHRRLLAGQLCRELLQGIHRWVLAVDIVPQLGGLHGLAHGGSRAGNGVAAQVNHLGSVRIYWGHG